MFKLQQSNIQVLTGSTGIKISIVLIFPGPNFLQLEHKLHRQDTSTWCFELLTQIKTQGGLGSWPNAWNHQSNGADQHVDGNDQYGMLMALLSMLMALLSLLVAMLIMSMAMLSMLTSRTLMRMLRSWRAVAPSSRAPRPWPSLDRSLISRSKMLAEAAMRKDNNAHHA